MKKTVLLLFLLSFARFSIAQQQIIDSLKGVLRSATVDSVRCYTMINLAYEYIDLLPDSAQSIASRAQVLARQINYLSGQIMAFNCLAEISYVRGDFTKAKELYSECLKICEQVNNPMKIARTYNNLGVVCRRQGQLDSALTYYLKALKIKEERGDSADIASQYANISIIYSQKGDYAKALEFQLIGLKLQEPLGRKDLSLAQSYGNLGEINRETGDLKTALKYFSKAAELFTFLNDKFYAAMTYGNIANCYMTLKQFNDAENSYSTALKDFSEAGNNAEAGITYNNLGMVYDSLNNKPKALQNYLKAKEMLEKTNEKEYIFSSYSSLGRFYTHNEPAKAISILTKALEMATEIGNPDLTKNAFLNLSEAYERQGNLSKALSFYKSYSEVNDSILTITKTKQITEMQTKYETEKKDKEIILLTLDKEVQHVEIKKQRLVRNAVISGFVLVLLLGVFGYRVYHSRQMLRLQDIRNSIAADLHDDIGSTLNSISVYSEVARQKDERQNEALEMIGDSSRKIIETMSDIVWTINPENDSFDKIIFRMKSLAYNLFRAKKIEYTFHADESLNEKKLSLEARRNLYLIFKEAINNIIKYSEATRVSIALSDKKEGTWLSIKDNGKGFDMKQETTGNGLKNMKRRADEMMAQISIESEKGNGTQIELILNEG